MLRFIAFAWTRPQDAPHGYSSLLQRRLFASSRDWNVALDTRDLTVLFADARRGENAAYLMEHEIGSVVGKLFLSDTPTFPAASERVFREGGRTEEIVRTGGRYLLNNFWGRYVAFWRDPASASTFVLRDPSGTLPCYQLETRYARVFCSRLEDCASLCLVDFTINWRYVATRLPLGFVYGRSTGLTEVETVLAGERVQVERTRAYSSLMWSASEVARSASPTSEDEAAEELHECTRACVCAWASCYPRVLVRMSGGLDSSIVLSCLSRAPSRPQVIGLTHHSEGADSDERPYARLVASHVGCELLEYERDVNVKLDEDLRPMPSPVPFSFVPYTQHGRLEAELAERLSAAAIFGGGGGDQLFYQCEAGLAATDFVWDHGVHPALLGIALSAARIERMSLWRVLGKAIRDGLQRHSWDPLAAAGAYRYLISDDVVKAARQAEDFVHPWIHLATDTPPGKLFHICTLGSPADYYDVFGKEKDPEYVHPLWSQPLIELCLRIPTYVLTCRGWDRALARRAFLNDLPRSIALRRSKGGLEEHIKEVLRRNMGFVRAMLLDGRLVSEGLVSGAKLAEVLSGRPTRIASATVEIYDLLGIEVWLRSWEQYRRVAAA